MLAASIIQAELAAGSANTTLSPLPTKLVDVPPSCGCGVCQAPRCEFVIITGSQPPPSPFLPHLCSTRGPLASTRLQMEVAPLRTARPARSAWRNRSPIAAYRRRWTRHPSTSRSSCHCGHNMMFSADSSWAHHGTRYFWRVDEIILSDLGLYLG